MNCAVLSQLNAHLADEQSHADRESRREKIGVELIGDKAKFFAFVTEQVSGLDEETVREQLVEILALRFCASHPAAAAWAASQCWDAWKAADDEIMQGLIGIQAESVIIEQDAAAARDAADAAGDQP